MVFDEGMLIPKDDMIVKKEVIYDIESDDTSLVDRVGYWLGFYRKKILPYIDTFRDLIEKGNGKTEIRMKDIRVMLGDEFKNKSDMTIYSRLKDILLEFGIKVNLHHWYGANLIMTLVSDENEIISEIDSNRVRRKKSANNANYSHYPDYERNLPSRRKIYSLNMYDKEEKHFFVGIGRRYIAKELFPGCIINTKSLGGNHRGMVDRYDWTTSNGIKIKHVAGRLRHSVDNDGYERDYFQWGIYRNDKVDIFLLTGWGNVGDLNLMKAWIFDKKDIVNKREFWDRTSFLISTHDKSMSKYFKFEVGEDMLKKIREKLAAVNQIEAYPGLIGDIEYEDIDIIDYRKENIKGFYSTIFRTVNWEK
jgi:hypothetical protein